MSTSGDTGRSFFPSRCIGCKIAPTVSLSRRQIRSMGQSTGSHTPEEVWAMVKAESGYVYQTHPRTKGSTGYPDKILNTSYFRDPSYLGTGWKSMPSDLSLPQLGQRGFKTLDDLNNLGFRKHMLGEIDVFQLSATDELYGLLNLNYLRLPKLPAFDHYDRDPQVGAKGGRVHQYR